MYDADSVAKYLEECKQKVIEKRARFSEVTDEELSSYIKDQKTELRLLSAQVAVISAGLKPFEHEQHTRRSNDLCPRCGDYLVPQWSGVKCETCHYTFCY